ncbi:hypothetical protein Ciccas_013113 [Cichlidogyrus casuarinus]|uniref:Uncharacterized protein n=1 Tax=Cichlidogyrus casuarinus TaxID=1844966 RepID=A0ABD2PM07_9PLAT
MSASTSNAEYMAGHGFVKDEKIMAGSRPMWPATAFDRDPNCYFYWVMGSLIGSAVIHHVISPWIFGRFLPTYAILPKKRRMEWDSRVLSTLHAICVCHFAFSCLLNDPGVWTQPVT